MKPEQLSLRGSAAIQDEDGLVLVHTMDVVREAVFEYLPGLKFLPA